MKKTILVFCLCLVVGLVVGRLVGRVVGLEVLDPVKGDRLLEDGRAREDEERDGVDREVERLGLL